MSEILLQEVNPNGNLQVVVEADDRVTFMYLHGNPESQVTMRAVWVRNHVVAPEADDVESMQNGQPPLNAARHCQHAEGEPQLVADQLSVVWLPEGDGVALYDAERLLAILPPWSGTEGFFGYSVSAKGEGLHAWEIASTNALPERFEQARAYWDSWDDEKFWPDFADAMVGVLEQQWGPHTNYYAIDGGNWPPKAMLRFRKDDCQILATVGMSMRPQPQVESYTEKPELLRRAELAIRMPLEVEEDGIRRIGGYISAQSSLPWHRYTWLGPGHTVPCDSWGNPEFTSAMLHLDEASLSNRLVPPFLGDRVRYLWLLPITDAERQHAIDHSSEKLLESLPPDRWKSIS